MGLVHSERQIERAVYRLQALQSPAAKFAKFWLLKDHGDVSNIEIVSNRKLLPQARNELS